MQVMISRFVPHECLCVFFPPCVWIAEHVLFWKWHAFCVSWNATLVKLCGFLYFQLWILDSGFPQRYDAHGSCNSDGHSASGSSTPPLWMRLQPRRMLFGSRTDDSDVPHRGHTQESRACSTLATRVRPSFYATCALSLSFCIFLFMYGIETRRRRKACILILTGIMRHPMRSPRL